MKHLKQFEAFTLPGRNPEELIKRILSDITDEFGQDVEIYSYYTSGSNSSPFGNYNITTRISIKQLLKKSEIEQFCDEYLIPGIGRIEDEGFTFKPYATGIFGKLDKFWNKAFKTDEMWYEGIYVKYDNGTTLFYIDFKYSLK